MPNVIVILSLVVCCSIFTRAAVDDGVTNFPAFVIPTYAATSFSIDGSNSCDGSETKPCARFKYTPIIIEFNNYMSEPRFFKFYVQVDRLAVLQVDLQNSTSKAGLNTLNYLLQNQTSATITVYTQTQVILQNN